MDPSRDDETVREFLRRRGAPDHVVAHGLPGLVESWARTAEAVARGYRLGLDDYLNDLDARQLIEDAWGAAPDTERARVQPALDAADEAMRLALAPAPRCLWGAEIALYHGWTPERNWWYFGRPRNPGADLEAELTERGL